ncbi:MAG: hypothetical protein J6C91_06225 [Muribaculaceae bacterium]|nr:hypothetical protein [Muribaculaceae bacterium]
MKNYEEYLEILKCICMYALVKNKKGKMTNEVLPSFLVSDTPMPLAGGLYAVSMDEEPRTRYTVLFDLATNRCGAKKYSDMESVYDIKATCASDEDGNLICYADIEDLQGKEGYDDLPDSIKSHLEKNNRILLIYPFSKLSE